MIYSGTRIQLLVILLLLIGLCSGAVAQDGRTRGGGRPASRRPPYVLVRATPPDPPTAPPVDVRALAKEYGAAILERVPGTEVYVLRVPAGQTPEQFAAVLELDPRLLYAEADIPVETPETNSRVRKQMPLAFDGDPSNYQSQFAYTQVNIGQAHTHTTGEGVIVAVLDTGATFTHPALQNRYLPGYNAINPGLPPTDIADGARNEAVGHGTMTAGIIARVAPGARILPVRVLNGDGIGTMLSVAKGIYYAIAQGARVLNMSFGTRDRSEALKDALDAAEAAGLVLVASAGNDGAELEQYPAHGHGAIAVAALEANNRKCDFSSYGSFVRVCAPGRDVWSTFSDGGYASWSGTSFSAPFVSAQAALLFGINPAFTEDQVKDFIEDTARDVDAQNPDIRGRLGKGLINIQASVQRALP